MSRIPWRTAQGTTCTLCPSLSGLGIGNAAGASTWRHTWTHGREMVEMWSLMGTQSPEENREHSWTQPLIPSGMKSSLPPALADFHLDPQPGESFLQPHRARTFLSGVTPSTTGITDTGERK